MYSILDLNPDTYQPHQLHTQERDWAETNCYVDVWIEQLHALGMDPIPAMAFSLGIDFEGDQWTFFKFSLSDLYNLYGIEVQELVVWKDLTLHIEEQVKLGRPVLVELDSKYLPDTAGTAYKTKHVKTTVSVNEIDIEKMHLGYFHAQGYYHLSGDDFKAVFRLEESATSGHLAPYVEIAKLHNPQVSHEELVARSKSTLIEQLKRTPEENPFKPFRERFESDFEWLLKQEIDVFHEYAFVTFRQFGACFEIAANYLDWLKANGEKNLDIAISEFRAISETTKVYQFQLARSVSRGKPLDFSVIDKLGQSWDKAFQSLKNNFN